MLKATGITVRFGAITALDNVDIEVGTAETVAVLGPSGSGKSTLLRVIAGLQSTNSGAEIRINDRDVTRLPSHRRELGLMFQDHALFPHLNVAQNVEFGLVAHKIPRATRQTRVAELLDMVGLDGLGSRAIHTLSGGQQQRAALARALAPAPQLLMLDEPFGQLDRALTERLIAELRELFAELGTTVLAVTHNHEDAFALAHRVAVMNAGGIMQLGEPAQLWAEPVSSFVAEFLGFRNIAAISIRNAVATTPWGSLPVDHDDGKYRALLRPQGVELAGAGELAATVVDHRFRGDHTVLWLRLANDSLLEAALPPGQPAPPTAMVRARVNPAHVVVLERLG